MDLDYWDGFKFSCEEMRFDGNGKEQQVERLDFNALSFSMFFAPLWLT